jgi:hypothetical protein
MIHVLTVGTRVRESLPTFIALEGLSSRMKSQMLCQVVLVFKRLVTRIALVWPLTYMAT